MSKSVREMNRNEMKFHFKKKMQKKHEEVYEEMINDGADPEKLEGLSSTSLIQDNKMVIWKSTKTEFIKMYIEYCKSLFRERKIDVTEYGFLNAISLFLDYEDNTLVNEEGFPF